MVMRRMWVVVAAFGLLALVGVALGVGNAPQQARGFDPTKLTDEQEEILSGLAQLELFPQTNDTGGNRPTTYRPRGSGDCTFVNSSNVKVNQNCLNLSDPDLAGRGQSQNETSIA